MRWWWTRRCEGFPSLPFPFSVGSSRDARRTGLGSVVIGLVWFGDDGRGEEREDRAHLFGLFVVAFPPFLLLPKNEASTTGPVTPGGLGARAFTVFVLCDASSPRAAVVPEGTAAAAAAAASTELDWFFAGEGATESVCC